MKLSVSLPTEDLATLDEYARARGLKSRSAALHDAVRLLRHLEIEQDYAAAWEEWEASGEEALWASAAGDGRTDAAR